MESPEEPIPLLLERGAPFPPAATWQTEPIVAIGFELTPELVLGAYRAGAYLLPYAGITSCWWSPEERGVIYPDRSRIPRSLRRVMQRGCFELRVDTAFEEVIEACQSVPRGRGQRSWIVPAIRHTFVELHRRGHAHSFEAWQGARLVGGLYGFAIGRAFFGESMFHLVPDASKFALASLCDFARAQGLAMIDCQDVSPTVTLLGAERVPRERFLRELGAAVAQPELPRGPWTARATAAPSNPPG